MLYDIPADGLASPHILFILLLAILLEVLTGGMPLFFRVVPHPVVVAGGLIGFLDRRLNREQRSEAARRVRGILSVAIMIAVAYGASALVLDFAAGTLHGWLLEIFFVMILISPRGLYSHVRAVGRALEEKGLAEGRVAVSQIVGRDPDSLDQHGVVRAAVESCAENFNDGVIAPIFWYLLFGLPGLFIYKTVNTLDSMIGHKSPRHKSFGWAAARLDDVLGFIPARLSGLMLCGAALFTPTANPLAALHTMLRDARNHSSPNAGWPEGAAAGALDLALAGPRRYGGAMVKDKWIGKGRARATPQDIRRMLFLYCVACLILTGVVAGGLAARLAGGAEAVSRHVNDAAALYDVFHRFLQGLLGGL